MSQTTQPKPNGNPAPPARTELDLVDAPAKAAREVLEWFHLQGGRMVVDDQKRCYLLFEGELYRIRKDDPDFECLMLDKLRIVSAERGAEALIECMRLLCLRNGKKVGQLGWTRFESRTSSLYIHLHDEQNRVLLLHGTAQAVSNGDAVILREADRMLPIAFDPEADVRQAVESLRELVADMLPIDPDQRWMVISWLLSAFFLDCGRGFCGQRALLKLSGGTVSGKTTAARMLCYLLFGQDDVMTGEADAFLCSALSNPLLALRLEVEHHRDDPQMQDLLVGLAEGKGFDWSLDDGVRLRGRPQALAAVIGIEPFVTRDLIWWSWEVECKSGLLSPEFSAREHFERIAQARSGILSGLFRLFARDVMPGLSERRVEVLKRLGKDFPGHPKRHLDAYLSLAALILRALMGVLHRGRAEEETWRVLGRWIEEQDRIQQEALRGISPLVFMMDTLANAMRVSGEGFTREFHLKFERSGGEGGEEIAFEATSMELLMALQTLAAKKGVQMPFVNAAQLSAHLASDRGLLEEEGWELGQPRRVRGQKVHSFRKQLA